MNMVIQTSIFYMQKELETSLTNFASNLQVRRNGLLVATMLM